MPELNVLEEVKAELGKFGAQIAEDMKKANERVAELDKKISALPTGGTTGAFRSAWEDGLRSGKPLIAPAGVGVDEVIERGREHIARISGVEYVELGSGVRLPVMRSLPRRRGREYDPRALMGVRVLRSIAAGLLRKNGQATVADALKLARSWNDKDLERVLEETADLTEKLTSGNEQERSHAQRALGTVAMGSGASFITPEYAGSIIDYTHAKSVVLASGVSYLPMPSGQLGMPFLDSAISVSMVGEHVGVNESSPQDRRLNLARKIMQAIMALSKELVAESSYDVDAWAFEHIAAAMGAFKDLKLLRGDGTQDGIRGMLYWAEQSSAGGEAHSFNRTLETGAVTFATIAADANKAMRVVADSNVPESSPGWIMSNRELFGLMSKKSPTTGYDIWPELRGGTFYGRPVKSTSQIPKNLAGDGAGTGTGNKSDIYYAQFGNLIHATTKSIEINAFDGGSYKDANGVIQSGITNREVVLAADEHFDFADGYRGASIAAIRSVDWGA